MAEKIRSSQIIACLNQAFPKFNRVALCYVRNPEYGCALSKEAEKLLKEAYPDLRLTRTGRRKRAAARKKAHHLTLRLDDEAYAKFEEALKSSSVTSKQEFLEKILEEYYDH